MRSAELGICPVPVPVSTNYTTSKISVY